MKNAGQLLSYTALVLIAIGIATWTLGKRSPVLHIHCAGNLAPHKLEWVEEFAVGVERATGMAVHVQKSPFFFWLNEPWLSLAASDFKETLSDGYEVVSLENLLSEWVKASMGVYWLAPGEVVCDGRAIIWNDFHSWLASYKNSESNRFHRRDLFPLSVTYDRHWGPLNGLYPTQTVGYRHSHFRIIDHDFYKEYPEAVARDAKGKPLSSSFSDFGQFSNHPDLLAEPVLYAISQVALKPAGSKYRGQSIFPNDSYIFSEIPDSHAHLRPSGYYNRLKDHSEYVFHFANEIAERAERKGSDTLLWMDAYMNWLNVPDAEVNPHIAIGVADDRSQWYDQEYKDRDLKLLHEWKKKGLKHLGATDYIFGQDFLIPRSLVGVVSESIPLFYREGLNSIYQSYVAPLWGYDAHTTWLAAQLCWDAGQDPEELLKKFFRLYYGPAADSMRKFFDTAERIWMEQPGKGIWLKFWQNSHQASLYGDAELRELEQWLSRAEREAKAEDIADGLDYIRRVGYTRDLFDLTKTFVELVQLRWAISTNGVEGFTPAYRPYTIEGIDLSNREGRLGAIGQLQEVEETLREGIEQAVQKSPLHKRLERMKWMYSDSPASRILGEYRDKSNGRTLLSGWDEYDTRWKTKHLDTENVSIKLLDGMLRAENVFRGYTYRLAYASEGNVYRAEVPFEGVVGPSSMVYVKLDFYNESLELISSSKWDRLAPGEYREPIIVGPEESAPEGSKYVRLYIRFFQQEMGDWVNIGEPELIEFSD